MTSSQAPIQTSARATRVRLNLGCGANAIPGFVNVDILPGAGVDVVADLREPLPFTDGAADLVYASHVLEHFPTEEIPSILADWRRVLRDGGLLLVAVPDLETIARCLLQHPGWFTPPHNPWLGAVYGGQKDEFDFHKTGFTLLWLAARLDESGFGALERVNRFEEVGVPDLSRSELPFGVNISLNVRAVAGGSPLPERDLRQPLDERVLDRLDRVLVLALRSSVLVRSRVMARRRRRLESAIRGS